MNKITDNFEVIKQKLAVSGKEFLLNDEQTPQIIAVSKTHTLEKIIPLLDYGHRIFGENKVQEASNKWPELKDKYQNIELHLIGSLQTNKVKEAVALFDVIETLDRKKLADSIAKELDKTSKKMGFFTQVNIGEEEQKSGILPNQADEFIQYCTNELKLNILGLMCIPPANEPSALYFALLRKIAERNKLQYLSMGMSGDYQLACSLGASHVRVGSAIFGERNVSS